MPGDLWGIETDWQGNPELEPLINQYSMYNSNPALWNHDFSLFTTGRGSHKSINGRQITNSQHWGGKWEHYNKVERSGGEDKRAPLIVQSAWKIYDENNNPKPYYNCELGGIFESGPIGFGTDWIKSIQISSIIFEREGLTPDEEVKKFCKKIEAKFVEYSKTMKRLVDLAAKNKPPNE